MTSVLGRYRIVGLLGEGGMGQVHLAFDPILERYVAIKQISASILAHPQNETLLAYFEREAKVVASLQHQSIIQIYEYGSPPGEAAWIVTEFIDGISFEELCADIGKLPARAVVALLHPMAEALEFAHERGIIHRDLKPGNVMLSRHGRVFLMDFGLAKPLGGYPGDTGLKSMIIGSPAFMAPEQVGGESTDRRSDIFSFGLLAYAMASGELFFSATAAKAFKEILGEEYEVDVKLANITDPDLRELIGGCVQREPDERFQTMEPVVDLLDMALARHRVGSPGREARRWAARWADLMPQAFSLAPTHGQMSRDTTPKGASFWSPTLPPAAKEARRRRKIPSITFGKGVVVSDQGTSVVVPSDETEAPRRPAPSLVKTVITGVVNVPSEAAYVPDGDTTIAEPAFEPPPEPVTGDASGAPPSPVITEPPRPSEHDGVPALVGVTSASELEVVDDPDGTAALGARLDACSDPAMARRLTAAICARGGELTFAQLHALIATMPEPGAMTAASGALAELVGGELLEQVGDDALALADDAALDAIWALTSKDEDMRTVARGILDLALREAEVARERFEAERAIDALDRAGLICSRLPSVSSEVALGVLLGRAAVALEQDDDETARGLYLDAIGIADAGTTSVHAARHGLGEVCLRQNRAGRAMEQIDTGLEEARASRSDIWIARFHRLRGRLRTTQGQLRPALVDLRVAASHIGSGSSRDAALVKLASGRPLWWTGRYLDAIAAFGAARDYFEDEGDIASLSKALVGLGWVRLRAGQLDLATEALEEARGSAKPAGARAALAESRVLLGEVARLQGDLETAVSSTRRGLMEIEAVRDPRRIALARAAMASVLADAAELAQAERLADEAYAGLINDPTGRITAGLVNAKLACLRGEYPDAARVLFEVVEIAAAHGALVPIASLLRARLARAAGDSDGEESLRAEAEALYAHYPGGDRLALDDAQLKRWFS